MAKRVNIVRNLDKTRLVGAVVPLRIDAGRAIAYFDVADRYKHVLVDFRALDARLSGC